MKPEPLAHPCPSCGAPAGRPCLRRGGRWGTGTMRTVHLLRRMLASDWVEAHGPASDTPPHGGTRP